MSWLIESSYFLAAVLFILGLQRMSSPVTARSGILWAGVGMILATIATFATPDLHNYGLMMLAILIGSTIAFVSAKKVAMADMPQMIALYNGMGGGAAAAIAAVELIKLSGMEHADFGLVALTLAVLGAIIGTVSLSGSIIAFAKLQGLIRKSLLFSGQNYVNLGIFVSIILLGLVTILQGSEVSLFLLLVFFVLAFAFGIMMTLPIGGADMPVVISLYNALTGLAVAFEGFVLGNAAMIIAGTVVGAAGTLLTQLMAKAMNRSLTNVLFSKFGGSSGSSTEVEGDMKPIDAPDVAVMMAYASKVIIIPGYGMAVAQAQHKIWELTKLLQERGVDVKFAIHPVAGRMPGHMNVLLAEAGVPYDIIADLDEINAEFPQADVALVIGANDVVNPVARTDPDSPIYGMPILDADKAKNVIVVKRGRGAGFSGVENGLFFADNTRMLFGDGQKMAAELIQSVKEF
ncbi:NAD(P)(+) transhydrogenase (Re/Si-specific) subunit beta [Candidatus Venteria ishoeyi]|uniref:NAD(P) transhydrogenase subunit beta n=1 Tax=Candidatus Venteria ishoeyi TaxID=1899563 RepID=A0A1H6FBV3_9GAMM|nr:NAD(P)(+) transhydrogenase (Re/Si-specific) subunit beta [Candidatus Venteria ishoeyi]MDM8546398.1 NAD(P)(+) transhydrogenase (Re/Si-specific) subunit beta [Candidatus Venteria ishoeyi]SEH07537.1 NAD(P) transhydrogenase subunit beta [Candidatus Venteria ishoeyi]